MKDYKTSKRAVMRGSKRATEKRSHFAVLIQAMDLLSHHLFGFLILIIFTSILLSLPLIIGEDGASCAKEHIIIVNMNTMNKIICFIIFFFNCYTFY